MEYTRARGEVAPHKQTLISDHRTASAEVTSLESRLTAASNKVLELETKYSGQDLIVRALTSSNLDSFTFEEMDRIATYAKNNGTINILYGLIGKTKTVILGASESINMRVVAVGVDDLSDKSGKAALTFMADNPLATKMKMNSTDTIANGWEGSELRTWLNNDLYTSLSEDLKSCIKEVSKTYSNFSSKKCSDKLWVPDKGEVMSWHYLNNRKIADRSIYQYLDQKKTALRYVADSSTVADYWLRSNYTWDTFRKCYYYDNDGSDIGVDKTAAPNTDHYVVLCFCI